MSIHLMLVAAYLPKELVNTTQKLVLMKICDSADDQTRQGRPGLERMTAWAGVSEKRVTTVVTELVGLGLVERVEIGRVKRRAEYRVFPLGVPPIPSTEELVERRKAARQAPKNPNLARTGTRRRKPSPAARTLADEDARREKQCDGLPQGNPPQAGGRVPPGQPSGFPQGNQAGSPRGTPSVPPPSSFSTHPPPPGAASAQPGDGGGQGTCPVHEQPSANCRGCGTNPRAVRARTQQQQSDAARHAQRAWFDQFLANQRQRVQQAQADPGPVAEARARAQELARQARRNSGRSENE